MSVAREIETLRTAAGLVHDAHVAALRVSGPDAFEVLDALSTRPLFLREGQLCHTLFLHEDAALFADVYVGFGEDAFYVLAEGPTEAELLAYVRTQHARRVPEAAATASGLAGECVLLGVHGPFAWEVVAQLLGPAVLGMPYLTLMHVDAGLCLRAGKTGEYGYELLVQRERAPALLARLHEVGAPLGLGEVTLPALDLCALENFHFSMRQLRPTRLAEPLTPLELQLQWRVTYDREFPGAQALRARRDLPGRVRATCSGAEREIAAGQAIVYGDQPVGELLVTGLSHARKQWIGLALLPLPLAHPHITALAVAQGGERVPLVTLAPPLIDNLSLHVDPHRHSYRTREADGLVPQRVPT